jgi:hypothetical protein
MKKHIKLSIRRETLRVLSGVQLSSVGGAADSVDLNAGCGIGGDSVDPNHGCSLVVIGNRVK